MSDCNYKGPPIPTDPIKPGLKVSDMVERFFNAYNGARIQEICSLLKEKALAEDVTLGVSLAGALTPAGLGASSIVPLIENGFIDYIVSTGANLYHDMHFALGIPMHKSSPFISDIELKKKKLIRIYDIIADFDALVQSDKYLYSLFREKEFQKLLSTSELHYLLGKHVAEEEEKNNTKGTTILAAAYKAAVPVYCPSPGDSTIGLNLAAMDIATDYEFGIDVIADVNETAAIVYDANLHGKNGIMILGGGSPKNFILQTVPQINEILEIPMEGHDYFMQITDARPDTGGLSGATPSEAVSWGKVNPNTLSDSVVAYADVTIALPIITAYVIDKCKPRKQRRLFEKRKELVEQLKKKYKEHHPEA